MGFEEGGHFFSGGLACDLGGAEGRAFRWEI